MNRVYNLASENGFSVHLTKINVTVLPQGFGRQQSQEAPARAFFKSRFAADIVSKRRISSRSIL